MLNWIAGDVDLTLAWVDAQVELPTTGEVELRVVPLLVERGRWADVARVYAAPVARLVRQHDLLQMIETHRRASMLSAEQEAETLRFYQHTFVELAERLCTALLVVGRSDEAERVASEARTLRPSRALDEAIARAKATAEGRRFVVDCSGPKKGQGH